MGAGTFVFLVELFLKICGAVTKFIFVHTDEADCVLFGIIAGACIRSYLKWHMVFCIIIGIVVTAVLWVIMNTKIGFWIVAAPVILFWASFGYFIGSDFDMIWAWALFFVFGGVVIWLHICARNNMDKAIFDDAEEYSYQSQQQYNYEESNSTYQTHENYSNAAYESNHKSDDDYYEILGLKKGATQEEIKAAYRKLSKKYHPDVNDAANASVVFRLINEAYNALIMK